jgi:hypothetical protein
MNCSALSQKCLYQAKRSESLTQNQGKSFGRNYTVIQERNSCNSIERSHNSNDFKKIHYLPFKLLNDIHEIESSTSSFFSQITFPISTFEESSRGVVKIRGKINETLSSNPIEQSCFDENDELDLPLQNIVSCSANTHVVFSEQINIDMEKLRSWKPHIVIDLSIFEDDE